MLPLGMPSWLLTSMPNVFALSTTLKRLNPNRTSFTIWEGENVRSHPTTAFWLKAVRIRAADHEHVSAGWAVEVLVRGRLAAEHVIALSRVPVDLDVPLRRVHLVHCVVDVVVRKARLVRQREQVGHLCETGSMRFAGMVLFGERYAGRRIVDRQLPAFR